MRYLILACILACSNMYATDKEAVQNELAELKQILTPQYRGLSEAFALTCNAYYVTGTAPASTIVQAYQVGIGVQNGYSGHLAHYTDAIVITVFNDPTGQCPPGSQVIYVNGVPMSVSYSWTNEVVNGVLYVRHQHPTCAVYSTEWSQYVVF